MQHKYKLNEKIAFIKPDDGYKEKNQLAILTTYRTFQTIQPNPKSPKD